MREIGKNRAVRAMLERVTEIDYRVGAKSLWLGPARSLVAREDHRPAQRFQLVTAIVGTDPNEGYYRPEHLAAPQPTVERIRRLLGGGELFWEAEYLED